MNPTTPCPSMPARPGFSLVELMVVVAVIGMLTAIVVPAATSMQRSAEAATELSSARRMTTAWLSWSTDHNGQLLESQLEAGADLPAGSAPTHHNGTAIPDMARRRWLWRLYDHLDDPVSTLWSGAQRHWWDTVMDGSGDMSTKLYTASLHPTFGINGEWIGGRQSNDSDTWTLTQYLQSQDALATPLFAEAIAQLKRPADLVLFASARGTDTTSGGQPVEGWWRIEPPYKPGADTGQANWAQDDDGSFMTPTDTSEPADAGFVSARHGGRTVTAAPDGSVHTEPFQQLPDMRRWADGAWAVNWTPQLP